MSRNAVDITIEQTINKHAKSHGGIIGFSRNHAAYYRWCVTRHQRAQFAEATMNMAGIITDETGEHKELRFSQMKSSQEDVEKVIDAFHSFVNPFTVENREELYRLSSGVPAPPDIKQDLLAAIHVGMKARDEFVKDRLVDKVVEFHDPIKRVKSKTFASLAIVKKVTTTTKKLIQVKAERNKFGQLILLSVKHNIDLQAALSFPLGHVPWSLATSVGSPVKTDKSKLMHIIESTTQVLSKPPIGDTVCVIDGSALLQAITFIPNTFEELAKCVFGLLPTTKRVDCYNEDSIKSFERCRRGSSPTFLLSGPKTKTPRDWKAFMSNNENKKQLIKLLLDEWKGDGYAKKLYQRELFFVCGINCFLLTSEDQTTVVVSSVPELDSSQEEADTRIILHCIHIGSSSPVTTFISVRSPDTDVLILLIKFGVLVKQKIFFDTGNGNERRFLDIQDIIASTGPELSSILPAVHAFTGCDTTSAFVRRGKTGPLKVLQKYPEYIPAFGNLGHDFCISAKTYAHLEQFVCCMYGKSKHKDVNKLRFEMFSQRFQTKPGSILTSYDGVDMCLLPPCRKSLRMHIARVNYQAMIWNLANVCYPSLPSPVGNGWTKDDAGNLVYEWTQGDILPQELVDILGESQSTENCEVCNNVDDENMQNDNVYENDIMFDDIFEDDN